ncbi:MAG: vitamin B12 dependent-methionine synthase activation domain-containing protein [Candidatus Fimimorpha sp.]
MILVDRKEVLRYLGYGKKKADAQIMQSIEDAIEKLQRVVQPRWLYEVFPLTLHLDGTIDFHCFQAVSKNLSKNLTGCEQVVIFAATLGIQVDLLVERYVKLQISQGVIMQAVAAAMIEQVCDTCQETIRQQMEQQGWYLRPRFSPGYGDFALEHQRDVISVLQCPKKIGLTLTDSLLMAPTKSVTAVIGLSRTKQPCHRHGCEVCEKTDCAFRR